MDMHLSTELRSVTSDASGNIIFNIRLAAKLGDAVLGSRTHVGSIEPEADIDERMAIINASFARGIEITNEDGARFTVPYPPLDAAGIAAIKQARTRA